MKKKNEYLIDYKNKLCDLAYKMDTAAVIEGTDLDTLERNHIKESILKICDYIKTKI